MGNLFKRLMSALLVLGAMTAALGLIWNAQGQEKKPSDVQMPRQPLSEESLITLDFQDVDLPVVIKFMGELTGKNFLVSDQVKGRVTLISPKKITVREAYKVFESVLEMNGYTAVTGEDAIKIVPSALARQSGLEIREGKEAETGKSEDRMITQIVPLEYASSDEVRNLFSSSISKDGMIVSYKPTNHLVITDRASNINRLLKIIEQIDVRVVEEKISVFSLEFASAKMLADKLNQLTAPDQRQQAAGKPPGSSAIQRMVRIIPDERTNALVVLASEQDTQEIRKLISQLDKEAPKGKSQLHVIYLEHARAEELAKVLNSIVTGKARIAQRTATGQVAQPGGVVVEEASITADKATNSVVITSSPQEFKEMEEVVQKLDMARSQVLVEALIAEVTVNRAQQIGVDWRLMDQPVQGSTRGFGGTDFGLISGVQSGTLLSSAGNTGLLLGLANGFITVGGVQVPNLGALVQAFQSDTDAKVLSTPQLLTMDNEKAKIIVADNVPVLKTDLSSALATTGTTTTGTAIARTYDYKDIGIQLEITPHISKGSMVNLEISAEVSDILSSDPSNPGYVITRKRQATTTVVVQDGQMIVIGGLIQDNRSAQTKKVPCVGNLPGMGWLFRNFSGTLTKTNLMIFITPRIIRTAEDMEKATAQQKSKSEENLKKLQKDRESEVKDTFDMLVK
ncbi:MAG: type II secretion system secretin GspD [Thermodesulfobacteriota bacterium]|jgi:general secretion pathway protein D